MPHLLSSTLSVKITAFFAAPAFFIREKPLSSTFSNSFALVFTGMLGRCLKSSVAVQFLPGSTPIKYLTPEAAYDETNRSNHFDAYIHSLGYELITDGGDGSLGEVFSMDSSDETHGHTLIIDYNRKRLFLLDSEEYHDTIEQTIEAYAKFQFKEMMDKATEVFDDGNGGWFETDPRDEQIQKYFLENGLIDNK